MIEHPLERPPAVLDLTKAEQDSAEEAEMLLVRFTWRFIELIVLESETYDMSLELTNVILSYLLGARFSPHPSSHCEQPPGRLSWRTCS